MKKNILLLLLVGCSFYASAQKQKNNQENIWQLGFYSIDSFYVDMKFYARKKIIIYAFDASNPNIQTLKSLDSLNRNGRNILGVIGIPVSDFGTAKSKKFLLSIIQDSIKLSFPIANISKGKKGSVDQHSLLHWITNSSKKNHFNIDIDEPNQFYIISTQGILYTVLGKDIDLLSKTMIGILNNEPMEN